MTLLTETYRNCRRDLRVPAIHALRHVREQARRKARIAETGFAWREDRHSDRFAAWSEAGFDLRVRIVMDDDGWWTSGVETLGRFTARWQPGAIRHHRRARGDCEWFLPANPDDAHDDYRRACAYGQDWWYVGVEATASRAGVALGDASLWGIDYAPGGSDDDLTEVAFDLASEAIAAATRTLRELCGCP
jgi:hypothetical protein